MIGWEKGLLALCCMMKFDVTRFIILPIVIAAIGFSATVLPGCRKRETAAVPSHSPESYMNDPAFLGEVRAKRDELRAIVAERKPLADRMQELVKEHGEDLAALQKIDEWNDLYKRVTALNEKFEAVRKRQLAVVRKRLTPCPKEISK